MPRWRLAGGYVSTFNVQVISSPGATLDPEKPMWAHDGKELLAYDIQFVKPALLVADKVTLLSDRNDMHYWAGVEISRMRMPLPVAVQFRLVSEMRHPFDMRSIDVNDSHLAPAEEAQAAQEGGGTFRILASPRSESSRIRSASLWHVGPKAQRT